jgi:hypothetical protein
MVTPETAKQNWIDNFTDKVTTMADRMGDADEFAMGVANYHPDISMSDVQDSLAYQKFQDNSNLTESEIRDLVVQGTDANTFDAAVEQLADKWDSNYVDAFTS